MYVILRSRFSIIILYMVLELINSHQHSAHICARRACSQSGDMKVYQQLVVKGRKVQ